MHVNRVLYTEGQSDRQVRGDRTISLTAPSSSEPQLIARQASTVRVQMPEATSSGATTASIRKMIAQ